MKRKFTGIEFAIVVCIVALVISMIIPACSTAKIRARQYNEQQAKLEKETNFHIVLPFWIRSHKKELFFMFAAMKL